MQYSPKLKKAIEQIKNILKDNDIAGLVVLHTIEGEAEHMHDGATHVNGMAEYLFHINTSYSAASFDPITHKFVFKGKVIHYKDHREKSAKVAGALNMLETFQEWSGNFFKQSDKMIETIMPAIERIEDINPPRNTSHEQQNN